MKKVTLLIFSALLISCNYNEIKDKGVVIGVEKIDSKNFKYEVKVSEMNMSLYTHSTILYTNTLYQVGDTIQITKKSAEDREYQTYLRLKAKFENQETK